ncbi:MAG TPA: hypothetical protein VMF68_11275 [Spirochaetia bacterium]|nr:hypothetical protein [Spirochaetia bacterium]
MAIELSDGGPVRLAVPAGSPGRGTALTRILALRASPGWIAGAPVRQWHYDGVIERAGTVYLVGPRAPGKSLKEVLEQAEEAGTAGPQELAVRLGLVSRLAHALLDLAASPAGWFALQSDSVIFLDDGGVLFLPPAVDQELREMRPFEENRDTFECLTHPDLTGERRAVFAVCVALYRLLTGKFPFHGDDPEVLHSQARTLEIQPPAMLVPGLDDDASELIMAGLGRARRGAVTLTQVAQAVDSWRSRSIVRRPTDDERNAAAQTAQARKAAADRTFQRRRFWQRNWRTAAIIAAAVIVVGAVGGTILKNVLAPRVTRGFSPARVVETFYESMNTLDHTTMQACVVNRAGDLEVNETMTLYVTSRVTMGYEGHSNIVSAGEWAKAGRPPLPPPQTLYGVTNLELTQERGEPDPVFLVHYQKWNPAPRPEADATDASPPRSEGHAVSDRLFLKRDRGDWAIYRIDRLSSTELPAPGVQ